MPAGPENSYGYEVKQEAKGGQRIENSSSHLSLTRLSRMYASDSPWDSNKHKKASSLVFLFYVLKGENILANIAHYS